MNRPKALLFDLGGVVLEVDFQRAFDHWARAAGKDPADLARRYSHDAAYERHERGEMSSADYFGHLREELGLRLSDAEMAEGWNRLLPGEIPGIAAVLDRLRGRAPLYVFSNTNPAHIDYFSTRFAAVLKPFDRIFLSSDLGHRKPEKSAFDAVCREIGRDHGEILFFDDTEANVVGARAAGLQAAHVPRHEDLLKVLSDFGF